MQKYKKCLPCESIYSSGPSFGLYPGLFTGFRGDTDKSKKLYVEAQAVYSKTWSEYDQHSFGWSIQPENKVSRRLSFAYDLMLEKSFKNLGFADLIVLPSESEIVFGKHDVTTVTNTLSGAFIFPANSYLTIRGRHYWSRAAYDGDYYRHRSEGSLIDIIYTGNKNFNANFLSIDFVYTWRFAPGSELSIIRKNAVFSEGNIIINKTMEDFRDLLSMLQTHSISLKILYYLDYQNFRKLFSSK